MTVGQASDSMKALTLSFNRWVGAWCLSAAVPTVAQVRYFTDRSNRLLTVLLLWIFYVFFLSGVCYAFVHVCLYVLCGHLLGKDWSLGSRLWCLTVSLSLSHWYPESGMVLDCIDSWSLHPYLLWGILKLWLSVSRVSPLLCFIIVC